MLVNRQTINCAFAFSCKKFALFELADPMRRKIFVQLLLQGEARLVALQIPKERLSGNLTSIGRMCSNLLCLTGSHIRFIPCYTKCCFNHYQHQRKEKKKIYWHYRKPDSIPQKPVSAILIISIIFWKLEKRQVSGNANGYSIISSGDFIPDIKHHHRQYIYDAAKKANIANIMQ